MLSPFISASKPLPNNCRVNCYWLDECHTCWSSNCDWSIWVSVCCVGWHELPGHPAPGCHSLACIYKPQKRWQAGYKVWRCFFIGRISCRGDAAACCLWFVCRGCCTYTVHVTCVRTMSCWPWPLSHTLYPATFTRTSKTLLVFVVGFVDTGDGCSVCRWQIQRMLAIGWRLSRDWASVRCFVFVVCCVWVWGARGGNVLCCCLLQIRSSFTLHLAPDVCPCVVFVNPKSGGKRGAR